MVYARRGLAIVATIMATQSLEQGDLKISFIIVFLSFYLVIRFGFNLYTSHPTKSAQQQHIMNVAGEVLAEVILFS